MLACVVVTYAITTVEQTVNTQNLPQINQTQLNTLENNLLNLLNQTSIFNATQPGMPIQSPS
jgi:hypothetical protein